MDGFIKGIWISVFILWLPLFISAIIGWFSPIGIAYKIIYTVLVLAIWIAPIGAYLCCRV